jgi:FkbM family methyltransferase
MKIKRKLAGLRILFQFDNWPVLILGRLLDRRTGLVTYRKKDLEILIDHRGGDENGTRSCLTSDMYRKHLRHISANRPVRVLDLGANGGGFPLLLQLEAFDLDQVVCVEMNRSTFLRLLINLSTNLSGNVVGLNAAVCGMPVGSEIRLRASRGGTALSISADRTDPGAPGVDVSTTTLAALCAEYFPDHDIDICKIDIEGAEYEVLDGSPDAVLRKFRNLIIEFHDPAQTPACVGRFLTLGFEDATGDRNAHTAEVTEVRFFRRREPTRAT